MWRGHCTTTWPRRRTNWPSARATSSPSSNRTRAAWKDGGSAPSAVDRYPPSTSSYSFIHHQLINVRKIQIKLQHQKKKNHHHNSLFFYHLLFAFLIHLIEFFVFNLITSVILFILLLI